VNEGYVLSDKYIGRKESCAPRPGGRREDLSLQDPGDWSSIERDSMTTVDEQLVYFNGVDALTGEPLFPPITLEELAKMALADRMEPVKLAELEAITEIQGQPHFAPAAFVNPSVLSETGWGVLFAFDEDPKVIDALRPLLDHRKQMAEKFYYEYTRSDGWRTNEDKLTFLRRKGVFLHGQVDPEKAPYYLLIVGGPEKIPYSFQFEMDTEFAIGRLHFDTPEEYRRYAISVVEAETMGTPRPRTAAFFGVRNANDIATPLSLEYLIKPLVAFAEGWAKRKGVTPWEIRSFLENEATKPRLQKLLGGAETPALLFTAGHGLGRRGLEVQGALLCSEWSQGIPPTPEQWFAANDVADDADVHGMIGVLFACFGAGTPRRNMFMRADGTAVVGGNVLAPVDFVANLPRRLLAHPRGGALAVVGHVDTAIETSFTWGLNGPLNTEYKSLVAQLMDGVPVGHAMDGFGARYGVLEVQLGRYRDDIEYGGTPKASDVAAVWAAKVDARSFVIVGDPAVRLNFAQGAS
jgi:hypothetical protein